jgi:hypothetical protein
MDTQTGFMLALYRQVIENLFSQKCRGQDRSVKFKDVNKIMKAVGRNEVSAHCFC